MAQEAEFWSVKLTQDIQGGYGNRKKGDTLYNLPKYQADALVAAGFASTVQPQTEAEIVPGQTMAEATVKPK